MNIDIPSIRFGSVNFRAISQEMLKTYTLYINLIIINLGFQPIPPGAKESTGDSA